MYLFTKTLSSKRFLPTATILTSTLLTSSNSSREFIGGGSGGVVGPCLVAAAAAAAADNDKRSSAAYISSISNNQSCQATSLNMSSSSKTRFSSLSSIDNPKQAYEDFLSIMPKVGLGTFGMDGGKEEVSSAITSAIVDVGYQRIDCAPVYFNEHFIGDTFQDLIIEEEDNGSDEPESKKRKVGKVKREDLFIVSKLASPFHQRQHVNIGLEKTLSDLNLNYIDLYLVHWPPAFYFDEEKFSLDNLLKQRGYVNEDIDDSNGGKNIDPSISIHDTWKGMEELVHQGKVKYIGVSNFPISLLHELMSKATIPPIVNQIECHPYLQQIPMIKYCTKRSIHVQAYSPLGTPGFKQPNEPNILQDEPILAKIAAAHNITVAQVCILWNVQRGTSVVVKSVNPTRQKENLDILNSGITLSEEEMESIATLGKRNYRYFRPEEWWEDMAMAVFD